MVNAVYTAEATSSGDGRNGKVRSSDGLIDQDVKMPPALGGPGGGTNPEELFAAAYATCFHSALRLVARTKKVAVPAEATVTAAIGIGPDGGSFAVNAVLTAHLPGLDKATAQELVEGAHQVCPYSKATRGNIDVELEVTV
ncbi:organic hydroperoxide resistance protein [Actinomycetes bacterium KLBMP 9759]